MEDAGRTTSGRARPVVLAHDDVGTGFPLVLVHAFPLDRRMWGPQRALAGRARVIAVDLPGFGQSPPIEGASIRRFAALVAGVLDHLGLARAAVAGCSMGGYVAQAFALAYPQRTAALGLVDTRAQPDTPEVRARRQALVEQVRAEGMAGVPERQLPKLLGPEAQGDPVLVGLVREMILQASPAGLIAAAEAMGSREDFRPQLGRIACPAAVLVGTEDAIVPVEEAQAMARALPRGRFVPIAGAGHLANLEAPEAVNQALGDLLAAVAA